MKLLYTINRVLENVEVSEGVFRLKVEGASNIGQGGYNVPKVLG